MAKSKRHRVVGVGINCPRCKRPTEARAHIAITEKQLRQPFYYSQWYYCHNPDCLVSTHMVEKFKVWNKNPAARNLQLLEEDQAHLDFIHSI